MKSFFKISTLTFLVLSFILQKHVAAQVTDLQLPTGANVVSGNVTISQEPGKLTINQTSSQAIINWDSFNLGSKASVYFNNNSTTNSTLNQILDNYKSVILGSIYSNGKLFINNPNGITIGDSANIRAHSFVASAMKIANQDFLNRNYLFTQDKTARLENSGDISAQYVALMAPEVVNKGKVTSEQGSTQLAASDNMILSINNDQSINIKVNPSKIRAKASNEGVIVAENGIVKIRADMAQDAIDATIRAPETHASGFVSANGVLKLVSNSGKIRAKEITLAAGDRGAVEVSGIIEAVSTNGIGGVVNLLGKEVIVKSGAIINASGNLQGGTIIAGGSWLNNDNNLVKASFATIERNALLDVSSLTENAGSITVSTNNTSIPGSLTSVQGILYARASSSRKKRGGEINISGDYVDVKSIFADVSSPLEIGGTIYVEGRNDVIAEKSSFVSDGYEQGGNINVVSLFGEVNLKETTIQTNSSSGRGGTVNIESQKNIIIIDANIYARGSPLGGNVVISSKNQDVNLDQTIIQTNGSSGRGGTIQIDALNSLTLNASLQVNSEFAIAGTITLEADFILIKENSLIEAKGAIGGGTILIGGSWQNTDPTVRQATYTTAESGSIIDASAIENGDGGTVVLWSDITNPNSITKAHGTIYAKGGTISGNGGRIETSGFALNVNDIDVSTFAKYGDHGEWLIDPYNITISSSGGSDYTANSNDEIINVNTLITALSSSNVTIFTGYDARDGGSQSGNITLLVALSSNSTNDLTLKAANDIILNADLMRSGGGDLILRPGSGSISGTGNVILSGGSDLLLAHGSSISNNIQLNSNATIGIAPFEIEYLIVAGGGGGGGRHGGGGGAGGMLTNFINLSSNSYTINVGLGGNGSPYLATNTSINSTLVRTGKGGDSTAFGLTAVGGGSGAGKANAANYAEGGGSGGGSDYSNLNPGPGILGQGNNGGQGIGGNGEVWSGGGGGGAGSVGGNARSAIGGNGGSGSLSYITGSGNYYAAGGGGATYGVGAIGGTGGSGIGGNGGAGGVGSNGQTNTGSGGGGGGHSDSVWAYNGGNGGSGVVIARYVGPDITSGGIESVISGTNFKVATFNSNGTLNIDHTLASINFSGTISGDNALTVNATGGTVTLTGTNRYTGNTTISGGTLVIGGSGSLNSGNYAGTISNAGRLIYSSSTNQTFAGVISGAGSLVKNTNTSVLTLSANNTYTGATTVNAGTLALTGKIYCPTSACNTEQNPAAIVTITSGATLEFTNWGWLGSFGSNNYNTTYLVIDGGTLKFSGLADSSAARGFTVTSNGATFENATSGINWGLTTSAEAIYQPAWNGPVTFTGIGNITIGHVISGANAVTKSGSGSLSLSAANTYTGLTTISGGTLTYGINNAISTGGITVNGSSAVLSLGTYTDSVGAVIVTEGSITGSGTLTSTSGFTFNPTTGITVSASPILAGSVTLTKSAAGTAIISGTNTYTGATTISAGILTIENNSPSLSSSSYTGNGSLIIQSSSGSFSSGITLTSSKINSSLANLTLGKSGNTASITISGNLEVIGNLTIYGPSILNGNVTTGGNQAYNGNATVLATDVNISSVGSSSAGGNITFTGNIDGQSAGSNSLFILSGAGNVSVTGNIGDTTALNKLGFGGQGSTSSPVTTNFSYTGSVQSYTASATGTFNFYVWGAQGGSGGYYSNASYSSTGGKGGYAYGEYNLTAGQTIYIYVGGVGAGYSSSGTYMTQTGTKAGGFNGGGSAINNCCIGTGGGGASDIRVSGTALSNRVIVAGGGGGGGNSGSATQLSNGGAGGGATLANSTQFSNRTPGSAGTGSLGAGSNQTQNLAGAGGGGYYGGGVGDNSTGGGGGSSYIGGVSNGSTIAGSSSMSAPGGGTQVGQSGNGYARIISPGGTDFTGGTQTGSFTIFGNIDVAQLNTASQAFNITIGQSGASTVGSNTTFNNTGTLTLGSNAIGQSFAVTGTLTASAQSAINVAGAITSSGTQTYGALNIANNTTLTSNSGTVSLGGVVNGAAALTVNSSSNFTLSNAIGSNTALTGFTVGTSSSTNNVTISATVNVNGAITIFGNNVTLNQDLTASSGNNVIISATGDFDNNAGSDAITVSGAGRWIVYTANDNTTANFGSLNSNNSAVFGATYSSLAPASVASGNRYVFAETASAVVISFVTQNETITYGGSLDLTDNYVINYIGGEAALANVHSGSSSGGSGTTTLAAAYSSNPTISITASGSSTSTSGNIKAGSYTLAVSVSGGTLRANYSKGSDSNAGTLTVNQKALTISGITAANKTYNGNTTATVDASNAVYTGLVAGDSLSVSATGTFANKNVGTGKTVTLTSSYSGNDRNNYSITDQGSTTASITAKALTLTGLTASNKVYDGNTVATISSYGSLSGIETGDTVTLNSSSADPDFNNKNVGTGKTVTVQSLALAGTDAGNYSIGNQTTTANITAKSISSLTLSASNKTYDGNTTASVSVSSSDIVAGDTVTFSNSAVFNTRHVATGKTVTVSSISISGGTDSGNYTLATTSGSTTANITQLASVTWNGNAGDGLWSTAGNWVGSALPDQNNVAAVVIPSDQSVTFDSDRVGTIGSTIANSGTLTFNGSNNFTFAQVISGTGALVKSGSNTLTLSGNNTYTGATTISAGTLSLSVSSSDSARHYSPSYSISSGAILEYNTPSGTVNYSTGNVTYSGQGTIKKVGAGQIQWGQMAATFALGSGSLIDVQQGTFVGGSSGNEVWTNNLSSLNIASGAFFLGVEAPIVIDALTGAGTLSTGFQDSPNASVTIGINNTQAGTYNSSGSATFSGSIINSVNSNLHPGKIIKSGSGTQILSGDNTYTGATTVSSGTLAITHANGLGTTAGATTVSSGAALSISNNITVAEPITISETGLSSGGALVFTSGNNTYSGAITLAASTPLIKSTGGQQTISGAINGAQALTITASDNLTLSGTIGATAPPTSLTVTTTGTGVLALNANISTSGTQSYTAAGNITINADRTLTGSTITTNSALSGAYALTITGNAVFGDGTGDDTVNLSGTGKNLSVSGTTTLGANVTTSGTQTYTGATTLSGGDRTLTGTTVNFRSTLAGGTNALTVTGNLDLDGAATGLSSLSVSGTSDLGANVTTSGTQTYTGAVTLTTNITLTGTIITTNGTIVGGGNSLTITGDAVFGNDTADTITGVSTLSVSGNTTIHTDTITTTGVQTYGDGTITATGVWTTAQFSNQSGTSVTGTVGGVAVTFTHSLGGTVVAQNGQIYLQGSPLGELVLTFSTPVSVSDIRFNMGSGTDFGARIYNSSGSLLENGTYTNWTNPNTDVWLSTSRNYGWPHSNVKTIKFVNYRVISGEGGSQNNTHIIKGVNFSSSDAITLGNNTTLATSNSKITFNGTVNSQELETNNLNINVGSSKAEFNGVVGGTRTLGAVAITGELDLNAAITNASSLTVSTTSDLGANVTTSGTQTYTGAVTLSTNTTLVGSTVTNSSTIAGGGYSLIITGNSSIGGTISNLTSFSVSGTTSLGGGVTTTTGGQTYSGAVTLTASPTLTSPSGTILFSSTVNGANALTITNSGGSNTGDVTFTGAVGGSTALTGLEITTDVLTAAAIKSTGTLSIINTGTSSITGVVSDGTTALAVTKAGSGTLTLSATNTYTGATTINAGTLKLGDGASATGSLATSGITNNATLVYDSSADQTVSYNIGGTGAVEVIGRSRTLSFAGNTYLTTSAQTLLSSTSVIEAMYRLAGANMNGAAISVEQTPAGIYNALFDSSTNTATFQTQFYDGNFTKVVFVKLQQSGNNVQALSYAGRNSYHTVYVSDSSGTGTTLGNNFTTATYTGSVNSINQVATSSSSGGYGVQDFQITSKVIFTGTNTYTGTTTLTNTVTARNSGGAGATSNAYRSQTARGTIQLGSGSTTGSLASTIISNAGLLILNRSDSSANLSSNISGAGHLIQIGTGGYIVSGTNTYTGSTIVNSGILRANNTAALGATSTGTTVVSGAALEITTSINAEPLTLNGSGISNGGALRNISGDNTYAGAITQNSASRINSDSGTLTLDVSGNAITGTYNVTFGGSGNITVADPIATSTGTLTKDGSGILTLSATNTYTGATTINVGTLATTHPTDTLTIFGVITVNSGAIYQVDGTDEVGAISGSGSIILANDKTLTTIVNSDRTFSGIISGGGNLTKSGTSTLTLSGPNTFSGRTSVAQGTLSISSDSNLGTAPGSFVSNQLSIANTMTLSLADGVTLNANRGISLASGGVTYASITNSGTSTILGVISGAALTKSGSGTLILSGNNTYTGSTTISEGTLAITSNNALGTNAAGTTIASGATLDLQNITYSTTEGLTVNGGTVKTSTGTSSFAGGVTLGANSTVDVTGTQLTISGVITDGASTFGLTKTGSGILVLSNANTYDGTTTISAGALRASSNTALGTTAGGVTVANGAALELSGGITIGAEALTLNGSGISSGGALRNISENNTYQGAITQASDSRINSDSGTLTLDVASGNAITGTYNVTFGGAGNITVADPIATSTGTLTKSGSGILTLSGANTYTGGTTISDGIVKVAISSTGSITNGAFGTGAVTVNSGGAIDLNSYTLANVLSLSGTGYSSSGALYNSHATSGATASGNITLAGATTIKNSTGSGTLTLSGTINGAQPLTITNTTGGITLNGAIGNTTPLTSLSISGASILGANVTTSGTQTYIGEVLINADVTFTSSNSDISFGSSLKSSGVRRNLIINAGIGNITISGDLGSQTEYDEVLNSASVATLTGGDPGEGGDFVGTFTHSANFAGSSVIVGDVTFNDFQVGTAPNGTERNNVTIWAVNQGSWGTVDLGSSANDNNLETVLKSIRWTASGQANSADNTYNGIVGIRVSSLTVGSVYKLQLLVGEGCCSNRGYDVNFNGSNIVDNFSTSNNTSNTLFSQVISYAFVASETSATITLDGTNTSFGDKNPIINGLTVERLATSVSNGKSMNAITLIGNAVSAGNINASGLVTIQNSSNSSINGIIRDASSSVSLTKSGSGILTLSGNNSYTGATTISAGTLTVSGTLADTTAVTVNSGTVYNVNVSDTIGSLAGAGTVQTNGTVTLTSGGDNTSTTFSGVIQNGTGTLSLAKSGSGTLTLSGNNSYTGATTISSGTLAITNANGLGTTAGATTVSSGAALSISNNITVAEAITISGTGVSSGGALVFTSGNNTYSGDIILGANSTIISNAGNQTISAKINGAYTLGITAGGNWTQSGIVGADIAPTSYTVSAGSKNIILSANHTVAGDISILAPQISGDVTITSGVSLTATGNSRTIVVAAGRNFINNSGSSALVASGTGSRWIVYTANDNTTANFGSLNSNNTPIWNSTYSTLAPASVDSGNRYVFAETSTQTVTFTTTSETITYGDSLNLSDNYSLTTSGVSGLTNVYNATISGAVISLSTVYSSNPTISITATGASTSTSGNTKVGSYTLAISLSGGTINSGYVATTSGIGTLTVNQKNISTLTLSASNKIYNGDRAASATITSSDIKTNDVVIFVNSALFDSKDVGNGKTVTVSSISISGGSDSANYNLVTTSGTTTANVTAKPLTLSGLTADNKIYDGGTVATISSYGSLTGIILGDIVTLNSSVANSDFDNKNFGTGKTVTVQSLALSGANSGNYSIGNQTTTANISKKAITATVSAADNKVYDGNKTASVTLTLAGVLPDDTVTSSNSSTFDNENVGTEKIVTVNSITLAGADNGNYQISAGQTTTAAITKKTLTTTLTGTVSKTYNGDTSATLNTANYSISGFVGSEGATITQTSGNYNNKNFGTSKSVTVLVSASDYSAAGSTLLNNYTLDTGLISGNIGTISKKNVTLTAPTVTKTYDGTVAHTVTTANLNDLSAQLQSGDVVTIATIAYANKNVGTGKTLILSAATIDDGNGGGNYSVTLANSSSGVINKAPLSVMAIDNAKFVTQSDPVFTFVYNGFVNGETASTLANAGEFTIGSVSRSNSSINAAGGYSQVLVPAGFSSNNYNISTVRGDFTIVPADQLIFAITAGSNVTYGNNPVYNNSSGTHSYTAKYLDGSNNQIVNLTANVVVTGSSIVINDGAGTRAEFDINAKNGTLSTSNKLKVGGYNLRATNTSITGSNFNSLLAVGSLTVDPIRIDVTNNSHLSVTNVSKTYDGTATISSAPITLDASRTIIKTGDLVTVSGTGSYNNRHVGTSKAVTIDVALSGADSGNYALIDNTGNPNTRITGNVGTISQLSSVTWTGPTSGGQWSNATNWNAGAIPDQSNVALAIIPTGFSVIYNSDVVGQVSNTTIRNLGVLELNGNNNFNLNSIVTGSGSITYSGNGVLTISGNNTYSGGLNITSKEVILSNANALGTLNSITSNSGIISVSAGTILPSLTVTGSVTIKTDITTTGAQIYNNDVIIHSDNNLETIAYDNFTQTGNNGEISKTTLSHGDANYISKDWKILSTSNANIIFNGKLKAASGSKNNKTSLVLKTCSSAICTGGQVTFADKVGFEFIDKDMEATSSDRQLSGMYSNLVGYNKDNFYRLDVNAQTININSNIMTWEEQIFRGPVKVGGNNLNKIKYLVSVDPAVTFLSTVSDSGNAEHSLVVRAIKLPGVNSDPKINFNTNNIGNLALFDPYALTLQNGSNLSTTRIGDFGSLGINSGTVAGYSQVGGARNSTYIIRNSPASIVNSSANTRAADVIKSLINVGNRGNILDFFKNFQTNNTGGGSVIVRSIQIFTGSDIETNIKSATTISQEIIPQKILPSKQQKSDDTKTKQDAAPKKENDNKPKKENDNKKGGTQCSADGTDNTAECKDL